MNRNIRIAKQLVKIAKELVASKPRVAYDNFYKRVFGIDNTKFERIDTYEQFVNKCTGFENSNCCMLRNDGKRFFDMYGAPYFVYNDGRRLVIMHMPSKQIKDQNDTPVTGSKPGDDKILNEAAYLFYMYGVDNMRYTFKNIDLRFEAACNACTGDLAALVPYLKKAQDNIKNMHGGDNDFSNDMAYNNLPDGL